MTFSPEGLGSFPRAGRFSKGVLAALLLLPFLLAAGCSHVPPALPDTYLPAPQPPVMSDEYLLQPGDVVEVAFLGNPGLTDTVTVRPDGRISLQMIDEVRAAGLTPAQLDDLLTRKFGLLLDRAVITVVVRSFTSDKVYVDGEVRQPRELPLAGRMNALQAICMAGGFRPDARPSGVVIVTRGPAGKPVSREVNLDKALAGELDYEEYRLRPFDIVHVPRTRMAGFDRFMSHFYSFIPPLLRETSPCGE